MSSSKRVLLTGATGFIGRHAIPLLVKQGYEVHAISSRPMPSDASAIWHQVDLLNPRECAEVVAAINPTHCLHFAWYAEHGKFWTAPENLLWVEASIRLLRALKECGCKRIVISGTCAEYDWQYGWCDEALTPLNPGTLYGVCKNSLRAIAAGYCAGAGISLAWGRIFLLYGPDESPKRLVPAVIRACLTGTVPQCSHGRQIRDFLHVRDVADSFVALLESKVEGAVNIGSGNPISLSDIVGKTVALCGAKEASFGPFTSNPNDPLLLVPRIDRLRNEVGWSPSINLEDGINETIGWWRAELAKGAK